MRKALSFLFLLVSFVVIGFLSSLIAKFISWGFIGLQSLSAGIRFIVYILCGATILGLAISPIYYDVPLTIAAAEGISHSKNGIRYVIFSAGAFVTCIWVIISNVLLLNTWPFIYIYMALFAVGIGVFGYKTAHTPDRT